MAGYAFAYRCPECAETFRWPREKPPPDRCPQCNAWVSEDEPEEFVPKAPRIKKSPYTKSVDQTYREMERSSIDRADEAAGILESAYATQPADEHDGLVKATQREEVAKIKSELKLTNMKDPSQMREGDTAHIGTPLSTTGAGFQSNAGLLPAGSVSPMVPFVQSFTGNHSARAMGMIRAGNIGTDRTRR